MTQRERRIARNYEDFKSRLGQNSISDYFQIKHSTYSLSHLDPNTFQFIIQQESFPKYIFDDLPIELSIKIIGFLYNYKKIIYEIQFPLDYPFKPTKWIMKKPASKLYTEALYILMRQYNDSWSPAITLETDILNMIHSIEVRREIYPNE
jgi:hypothetical protein